jgi:hypothetical protein
MDRINRYLDVVPLPLLIAAPVVAILILLIIPRRWHLDAALIGMVIWFVLGRLTDLGMIQSVTKATGFGAIVAVALAAWFDSGPKRRLPLIVWAYPVLALISFVYVITVVDMVVAMALRTQWLLMTVAAIFVARTIVDEASLHRVLHAIGLGACIALLAPMSDLLLHPGEAINKGLGRFEPYGANSNQIGVLFSLAAPLGLYLAFQTRHALLKPAFLAGSVAALGMGLLTGSRSTLLTIVVPAIPTVISMGRRPIVAVGAGVLGLAVLGFVVAQAGSDTAFERFGSLQTSRTELFKEYVRESVSQRPIFGLLGTRGMSVFKEEDLGHHAHNAYLDATYLGGLSYSGPLLVMVALTQLSALYLFSRRRSLAVQPLTISFLVALMFTIYAQGFVNEVIYYPTYEWALVHLILSVLMLGMAWDEWRGIPALAPPAGLDEEWDEAYAEGDPAEDSLAEGERSRA